MATTAETPRHYKKGNLLKRQRGRHHSSSDSLKFQPRLCELTSEGLKYYKQSKLPPRKEEYRGNFPIEQIRIVEPLGDNVFKEQFCFQVGDSVEVLYFACNSLDERTDWMKDFEKAAKDNNNEMLRTHHTGKYSRKKSQWLCCGKDKLDEGCTDSHQFDSTVVRRTKLKDERSSKRKDKSQERDFDSGFVSIRTYSIDHEQSDLEKTNKTTQVKAVWQSMTFLQNFKSTISQAILALKFMTKEILVLSMENNLVLLYHIPSNAIIHKMSLPHPISSIDVWRGCYLLIGSSLVQVVDTKQWKKTLVVDMTEEDDMKNPNEHIAVFIENTGEMVTATLGRENINLWPKLPEKTGGLMIDKILTPNCSGAVSRINSTRDNVIVLCTGPPVIDVFKRSSTDMVHLNKLSLKEEIMDVQAFSVSEDAEYMCLLSNNRIQELSTNTRAYLPVATGNECRTTCLGELCFQENDQNLLITGSLDGKVDIRDTHSQEDTIHTLIEKSTCAVTSVTYSREAKIIAAGNENGTLSIWKGDGAVIGESKSPLELLEIEMFSVYMPATFARHSIINYTYSFQATSDGGRFVNRPIYSLLIPSGAIAAGVAVDIQTGIITHFGSNRFKVPEKYKVLSPVIWLCKEQGEDFLKPLTLELQHCAKDPSQLTVMKAKCSGTSGVIEFVPVDSKVKASGHGYASFETNDFCYKCLAANLDTPVPIELAIMAVEGAYEMNHQRKEVTFCVSYYLDTCFEALEEQYSNQFNYHCGDPTRLCMEENERAITFACSDDVAIRGQNEVNLADLVFSGRTEQFLITAHRNKNYPPRVRYEVDGTKQEKVTFTAKTQHRHIFTHEVVPKLIATPSNDTDLKEMSTSTSTSGSASMNGYSPRQPDFQPFSSHCE